MTTSPNLMLLSKFKISMKILSHFCGLLTIYNFNDSFVLQKSNLKKNGVGKTVTKFQFQLFIISGFRYSKPKRALVA